MQISIALPSKGRMKEDAVEVIKKAGLHVTEGANQRSYRAKVSNHDDIEIVYLSASEIARELGRGTIDFGVTGEDLIREGLSAPEQSVEFCARLGFGRADVVVAIPDIWYDVVSMNDLGDVALGFRARHGRRMTIATKYWRLTQQFFSATHGIQLYRIVESLGATEGAPAAGTADIIVDITSTGSTLIANHLKVPEQGTILKSEACFVRALRPQHEQNPRIQEIVARLAAVAG